jgi:hypothetical protein
VQLAVTPGAKGMQELLHHIPTWISFRDTEKMEVCRRVAGGWYGRWRPHSAGRMRSCRPAHMLVCDRVAGH